MREFLAIVITLCLGLAVTTLLAYGLERRQFAANPVDLDADVRPGIISVSASGYASKFPERPLPAQPLAANVTMNPERAPPSAHLVSAAENSTVRDSLRDPILWL